MKDDVEYQPTGTTRCGNYYWCVKVPKPVCPAGEIYACADKVEVTGSGDLILWQDGKKGLSVNLAFAKGQWHVIYAASLMDGSAVAVEHWEGEVVR
jgi:hypothetical protein